MNKDEIKVSILCAAYNHENFIRKTLDGFVNQKTNFKYEVVINDDCSTDNTASIIKEYELKYPNIIKPIYQEKNQYSQGKRIVKEILLPKAKSEYIAMCEGDDCWINENKLQMQYDYMVTHSDCYLITSACKINNLYTKQQEIKSVSKVDRDYSFEECLCDEPYFNTCTFFFRKEVMSTKPSCFDMPYIGDIQIYLYASILGKVHYINEVFSEYNYGVPNSWTDKNQDNMLERLTRFVDMLNNVNIYYDYKYNAPITKEINKLECSICFINKDYKTIVNKYKNEIKKYNIKNKIIIILGCYFPKILMFAKNLKNKISINKKDL